MSIGTCKLSGATGKFVKSHLLPRALTRPEAPGLPLFQGGSGRVAIRRWDSWYDSKLVTRHGEDILEKYDTWAVAYLRRQQLVWSGWEHKQALGDLHTSLSAEPSWGYRQVEVSNPGMLRLFFLSLLWRAAASDMIEFSEIALPPDHLEELRRLVIDERPGRASFYPVTLTQLSTRGQAHNMTPIAMIKHQPEFGTVAAREIPIFRFYFDGLVAHFARQGNDDGWAESLGDLMVGNSNKLVISTVTYETSFERKNLELVMQESLAS